MKIAIALVALGLLQACASPSVGKKIDNGGRYLQGNYFGTVFAEVEFPNREACSAELRAATLTSAVDLICGSTSSASSLPYKGLATYRPTGIVMPLSFKGNEGCSEYKNVTEKPTNKISVVCK